jgi:hypothetical protein
MLSIAAYKNYIWTEGTLFDRICLNKAAPHPDNRSRTALKPVDISIVISGVLWKSKINLTCAPVETKGYKRMINLPDWHNIKI